MPLLALAILLSLCLHSSSGKPHVLPRNAEKAMGRPPPFPTLRCGLPGRAPPCPQGPPTPRTPRPSPGSRRRVLQPARGYTLHSWRSKSDLGFLRLLLSRFRYLPAACRRRSPGSTPREDGHSKPAREPCKNQGPATRMAPGLVPRICRAGQSARAPLGGRGRGDREAAPAPLRDPLATRNPGI